MTYLCINFFFFKWLILTRIAHKIHAQSQHFLKHIPSFINKKNRILTKYYNIFFLWNIFLYLPIILIWPNIQNATSAFKAFWCVINSQRVKSSLVLHNFMLAVLFHLEIHQFMEAICAMLKINVDFEVNEK